MIAVELGGWLAASAAGFAAARVWRAAAWRMETIARACHELRGPLTAARLGLDYGAGNGQLTPARLRAIDLELRRAALALDDLEGVRAPRTSWRAPEPIDLAQLVSDSVEAWRPSAAVHGVELRTSWSGQSPTVWGDRLRLAQVTGNLIANAIEHGGGIVDVRGTLVGAHGSVDGVHGAVGGVHGAVGEVHRGGRRAHAPCPARAGEAGSRSRDCSRDRRRARWAAGGGAVGPGCAPRARVARQRTAGGVWRRWQLPWRWRWRGR